MPQKRVKNLDQIGAIKNERRDATKESQESRSDRWCQKQGSNPRPQRSPLDTQLNPGLVLITRGDATKRVNNLDRIGAIKRRCHKVSQKPRSAPLGPKCGLRARTFSRSCRCHGTNETQEAQVYSHGGPITRRKR
eukprot:156943-Prorocentrum_minimum.AAC.1